MISPMATKQAKAVKARQAEAVRTRISRHAQQLLSTQLALALGAYRLMTPDLDGKTMVQVTDAKDIDAWFRGERRHYTFLEVVKGDNRAIDSMLDRAFGRPSSTDESLSRPQVVVLVGQGTVAIGPSPWDGADRPAGDRITSGAPAQALAVPSA